MKLLVLVASLSLSTLGCGKKSEKDLEKEVDKALAGLDKEMKQGMEEGAREAATGAEAELQLHRIGKQAKAAYVEQAQFPVGKVGPTPTKDCCASGGKCAPDAAAWADPTWKALSFSIEEAHGFQYSYESDGKTFTAKAIGCGDHAGTYTASGHAESGNAIFEVTGP